MGWEGREPSSVFRRSERVDGSNWLLVVAPSIVLATFNFAHRQSNEEQDGQNEFMDTIQQFRGPSIQKKPRVRKIHVRNSGAGNGCANFMDTWKNAVFLQENLHVHKIPRFGGGGVILFFGGGGGKCRFYFYERGDFSDQFRHPLGPVWESQTLSCLFFFGGGGGIEQTSRDMLQNGVSHRCATFVKLSTKGGVAPLWGSANLPENVSRHMGYRSDSIAISRDMGPARRQERKPAELHFQSKPPTQTGWQSMRLAVCTSLITARRNSMFIRSC